MPATARSIPDWMADLVQSADHVVHAGDFNTPRAAFELRVLAGGDMTAALGNRDPELQLPRVAHLEIGGVRFVVTHGHDLGRGNAYRRGLAALAAEHDADIAVGGHTHLPLDETLAGTRLLNPGSATGAPPADAPTCYSVACEGGEATVHLHR